MKADGHCGFRAIADQLIPGGEDSFHRVRGDMFHSLTTHPEWYAGPFMDANIIEEIIHAVNSGDIEKAEPEHWFRLPEMPYVVATYYNVAVVSLTPAVSVTYLPLRTAPPACTRLPIICIALVNNNHFISVRTNMCAYKECLHSLYNSGFHNTVMDYCR